MHSTDDGPRFQDVAVRDPRISDAVDEPMRAMILDVLSEEALPAGTVHDRLAERGFDRTENTVRHHINELRDAGLVEVARFEEGRGGTTKYYAATTIVLSYTLPDDAGPTIDAMVDAVAPAIGDALDDLTDEFRADIDDVVADMAPCDHCKTQKYETYVLLTVLRRAFVRSFREPERDE